MIRFGFDQLLNKFFSLDMLVDIVHQDFRIDWFDFASDVQKVSENLFGENRVFKSKGF